MKREVVKAPRDVDIGDELPMPGFGGIMGRVVAAAYKGWPVAVEAREASDGPIVKVTEIASGYLDTDYDTGRLYIEGRDASGVLATHPVEDMFPSETGRCQPYCQGRFEVTVKFWPEAPA